MKIIVVLFYTFTVIRSDETLKDSYLDAYEHIRVTSENVKGLVKKTDPEDFVGYPAAALPHYGPPSTPTRPVYGHPVSVYNYAPAPIYGPPMPPLYEMPHAMLGILDKFKLKLDLFTIGKILLKLVIFKKIVSLIAILCLLLFIPSLKEKHHSSSHEEDVEMRAVGEMSLGETALNQATYSVHKAIDDFLQFNKSKDRGKTQPTNLFRRRK